MSFLSVAGTLLLFGSAAAYAAPITSFSSSISEVQAASTGFSTGPAYYQNVVKSDGSTASSNITTTVSEGTATAYSSANLSTGELKAYSEAQASGAGGTFYPFTVAEFGDSFRTFAGGSPFTWTSSTEVSFSLDISGLVNLTHATNESAVFLQILAPGALDAYARWEGGDSSAYSEWSSQEITSFTYGLGGSQDFSYSDGVLTAFPTTISASFTPGENFDWVLGLRSNVNPSNAVGDSSAYGLSDFSHTIKVSYNGPSGTTTYSSSGFPGTTTLSTPPQSGVPEPATLSLFGAGLAGLWVRRRAKKRA